jgi:hypothetical protein
MDNSVIFYTQLASIVVFLMALFGVYRILISQKDATIELLKERLSGLKDRLKNEDRDPLNDALSKRVHHLNEELERLNKDKHTNRELISKKEAELSQATEIYHRLRDIHMHLSGMSVSYFCPVCEEPTLSSVDAKVGFMGNEEKSFLVKYSCGYSELNREKVSECRKLTTNKVL